MLSCVNHSSQLGGEIQAAETIAQTLTSQPSLSPDTLTKQLAPLLGQREETAIQWKPSLRTPVK